MSTIQASGSTETRFERDARIARENREFIAGELRNSYLRGPTSPQHEMAKADAHLAGWNDAQIWAALQPVLHQARVATLARLRCEIERSGELMKDYLIRECRAAGCSNQEIEGEVQIALHNKALCTQARIEDRPLELVPYGQY